MKFVWPAVAGGLAAFVGARTPSDFGPYGTVLERNEVILFKHPERHFTYLILIRPPLEEVLLVPFHLDDKPIGTVWAVIHESANRFDLQDRRFFKNLSRFAASAYRVLIQTGQLEGILKKLPRHPIPLRITPTDGRWEYVDS